MNRRSYHYWLIGLLTTLVLISAPAAAQTNQGIDPDAIIDQILRVDSIQRAQLQDVVMEAELLEGKMQDNGQLEAKKRFVKDVYIKYFDDTAWYYADYREYYEDGKLKSDDELRSEAKDRRKKKEERKGKDISYPILSPFYAEHRADYDITYEGVTDRLIEGYACHQFRVESKIEDDDHIDGDYYFEAESFHLVRCDFTPAKLIRKTMFKLDRLDMTLLYEPFNSDIWLPARFDIVGKGKAALLFGVNFAGTEFYRNPKINTDLADSLFQQAVEE